MAQIFKLNSRSEAHRTARDQAAALYPSHEPEKHRESKLGMQPAKGELVNGDWTAAELQRGGG